MRRVIKTSILSIGILSSLVLINSSVNAEEDYIGINKNSEISADIASLGLNMNTYFQTDDTDQNAWHLVAMAEDYNSYEDGSGVWLYFYNPYSNATYEAVGYDSPSDYMFEASFDLYLDDDTVVDEKIELEGNPLASTTKTLNNNWYKVFCECEDYYSKSVYRKYVCTSSYIDFIYGNYDEIGDAMHDSKSIYSYDVDFTFKTSYETIEGTELKTTTTTIDTTFDTVAVMQSKLVQPVVYMANYSNLFSNIWNGFYADLIKGDDKFCVLWFINFTLDKEYPDLNYARISYKKNTYGYKYYVTASYGGYEGNMGYYNNIDTITEKVNTISSWADYGITSSSSEIREITPGEYKYSWGSLKYSFNYFATSEQRVDEFEDADFDKTVFTDYDYSICFAKSTEYQTKKSGGFWKRLLTGGIMWNFDTYDDVQLLRIGYMENGEQKYVKVIDNKETPSDAIAVVAKVESVLRSIWSLLGSAVLACAAALLLFIFITKFVLAYVRRR